MFRNDGKGSSKLRKRLPILTWLPIYSSSDLIADFVSGVTVALTVIPQSIAYSVLAGLEPQYGLYSSFVGCFVYAIFGSVRHITIGPTALMALMTYQQIKHRNKDFAFLLTFLSGIVQFIMAALNLGAMVDFISVPVSVGFTSATSVIIIVSQLKGLFGLKLDSDGFLDTLFAFFTNVRKSRLADLVLGLVSLSVLLLMRQLTKIQTTKRVQKTFWLLSISRNAIVVLLSSFSAFVHEQYLKTGNESLFLLTGPVPKGLPSIRLPPFHTVVPATNQTFTFTEMCTELGSSILLVPLIAVLGNVAISKAFTNGSTVDATQELYTLSLSNVLGSLFSSMPITGSFSRSAVNHSSGVHTPFGGVYTGLLVIFALNILTPYFYYIPKASLSAVIISAVIFMIEYELVVPMWKTAKNDFVALVATFSICLLISVEIGILVGVLINVIFLLHSSTRPSVSITKNQTSDGFEYVLVEPKTNVYFPSVNYMRSIFDRIRCDDNYEQLPLVIDLTTVVGSDFTVSKGMLSIADDFHKHGRTLCFLHQSENECDSFRLLSKANVSFIKSINEIKTSADNSQKQHVYSPE